MSTVERPGFIILAIMAMFFCLFIISIYLMVKLHRTKISYENKINILEQEIRFDYLTGTLSRQAFIKEMEASLANDPNGTLLIFDINGFKAINDNFGHIEGDNLIKRYSAKLMKSFDKNLVGRLGGDEFLVFISGVRDEDAINAALKQAQVTKFIDQPTQLTMTSCCGVAFAPDHGSDFRELYKMADKALYRSKKTENDVVYCKT